MLVQAEYRLAWKKSKTQADGGRLVASCVACHAPFLYLTGAVPDPSTRMPHEDEGISCDFCHSIWGFDGDTPGQFNWIFRKGGSRFGPALPTALGGTRPFVKSPELCGTCHDEKGPGGQWVKSIYIEWKASPYVKTGEKGCLDCHKAFTREFVDSMIAKSVSLSIEIQGADLRAGDTLSAKVVLRNEKAGHRLPGGSAELRQLWLHVEATDASGKVFPLAVEKKGFPGEEYTLPLERLAYQDLVELKGDGNLQGLDMDGEGIAPGDRIFRLPMFDEKGRPTALEWNAFSLGTDYRLPPLETVAERFTLVMPSEIVPGPIKVRATLCYRRVPPSIWRFLGLPGTGNPIIRVNEAEGTAMAASATMTMTKATSGF